MQTLTQFLICMCLHDSHLTGHCQAHSLVPSLSTCPLLSTQVYLLLWRLNPVSCYHCGFSQMYSTGLSILSMFLSVRSESQALHNKRVRPRKPFTSSYTLFFDTISQNVLNVCRFCGTPPSYSSFLLAWTAPRCLANCWVSCPSCHLSLFKQNLTANIYTVQECNPSHFAIYPHRSKSHSPPEPQQRSKYLMHTQQILTLNFLAGHI